MDFLKKYKKYGMKIAFTNGCFDIIHVGHITLLRKAKKLGDILIVGLNSDESIKLQNKLGTRPINNENDRKKVLESIVYVDDVIIFNEKTPENLIKEIKPNFLVKGSDWKKDKISGSDYVESYGGCVKIIPFENEISTTKIIEKCRNLFK